MFHREELILYLLVRILSITNSKSKLLIDGLVWTNEAKISREYRDRSVPEVKVKAIAARITTCVCVCKLGDLSSEAGEGCAG